MKFREFARDAFLKALTVTIKPKVFMEVIGQEMGISRAAKYFLLMLAMVTPLYMVGLGFFNDGLSLVDLLWYMETIIMFLGIGILVGLFYHAIIRIFRAGYGPDKTVKVFLYSTTPSFVFGWIPYMVIPATIYSIIIAIIGIKILHEMSMRKAILIYLVPAMVIMTIAIVFNLINIIKPAI